MADDTDQLAQAERIVLGLRWLTMPAWLVIVFAFEPTVDRRIVIAMYASTVVYSAITHALIRRGRAIHATALATTVGDSIVVFLMCLVTGGIASPIYPYCYLTVLATAIRFGMREAFGLAIVNALHSLNLFLLVGAGGPAELGLRVFYLLFVALMGGLLSDEARLHYRRELEGQRRRRELLWQLIHAEEEERKRIAGEIHDGMGPRFFETYQAARRAREMLAGREPAVAEVLTEIAEEARVCSADVRVLMNELRPTVLDDFGFTEAAREYGRVISAQGSLAVTVRIDDAARVESPDVNVALFRILQEAVLNVRKHSGAKKLVIEFAPEAEESSCLTVRDDGRGFDPGAVAHGHYGLLYMRERVEACGGELQVRSAPGEGTEIRVSVPRRNGAAPNEAHP